MAVLICGTGHKRQTSQTWQTIGRSKGLRHQPPNVLLHFSTLCAAVVASREAGKEFVFGGGPSCYQCAAIHVSQYQCVLVSAQHRNLCFSKWRHFRVLQALPCPRSSRVVRHPDCSRKWSHGLTPMLSSSIGCDHCRPTEALG